MSKSILSRRFKYVREREGKTQTDIASVCFNKNRSTISRAAVAQWEKGDTSPSAEHLAASAKLLKISTDWLLGISENEKPINKKLDSLDVEIMNKLLELTPEQRVKVHEYIGLYLTQKEFRKK